MTGLKVPSHHTQVSVAMRADLQVWLHFLEQFNGVSFWREDRLVEAELQMHSDAVGGHRFGLYFRGKWCAAP